MRALIRSSAITGLLLFGLCGVGDAAAKSASRATATVEKPTIAVLYFDVAGRFTIPNPGYALARQLMWRLESGFNVVEYDTLYELLARDGLLMHDLKSICRGQGGPELLAAARKLRRIKYLVIGRVSRSPSGLLRLSASMCDWQTGQTDKGRSVTLEQKGWVQFVSRLPAFSVSLTGGAVRPKAKPLTLGIKGKIAITLARIPAGTFTMGSPASEKHRGTDEGPRREVTISKPFYMSVTEVTQAQWRELMGSSPWGRYRSENSNVPAAKISWDKATEYCKKLSAVVGKTVRLPTEAEWEYACRAGSKTAFYYGDDPDYARLGRYALHGSAQTGHIPNPKPVAWHVPNAWGLHDMHGSLWEWCSDRYAPSYDKAAARDPQGPDSGDSRVLRGGSQKDVRRSCRSANRHWARPASKDSHMGFRIVIPASEISK